MNQLEEILEYNKMFVENKIYEKYQTTKFPDKKMVIFSCMDTRLTHLLPKAMNLKNGDVKIIKNAGAVIMHAFGSMMRSIIVAVYELQADEVFVIGHYGCGMTGIDPSVMVNKMIDRGVKREVITTLENAGIDIKTWLHGFDCVEDSVKESVSRIRNHPLMPESVSIHGLIIDPETGELTQVVNGYK